MPALVLSGDALSWLDLMLLGAIEPRYSLPDPAAPSPMPQLVASADVAAAARTAGSLTLLDPEGVTLATVGVEDSITTDDDCWLAGQVTGETGFRHLDHVDLRLIPADVRSSWPPGQVLALWADQPLSFAVRSAATAEAEARGGSILQIVPVPTGRDTDLAGYGGPRVALAETTRRPSDRLVVVPFPTSDDASLEVRMAVARSFGVTALLTLPGSADRQEPINQPGGTGRLGVELVPLAVPREQVSMANEQIDALLADNEAMPTWLAEPAVADELRTLRRPRHKAGFTVLLSGLSGSGKSTVAQALAVRLVQHERRSVSLLDGDVVRHHLSKGLGFSRADRETNVRRIGFVASEITKAGGIAICCPIAPYEATRQDVRAMVEAQGPFVLVHVATPLAECERRDRKGLYAKARRGEIPEFTGISDPYEEPSDANVVIDTTGRSIDSCVDDVMKGLESAGVMR